MHLRISQKTFCLYCFCIVYTVAMTNHENRRFSFQTCYTFSKIHHKIVHSWQTCKFLFSSKVPKSCSFQKHKLHRVEAPEFEGDGCKYRDTVGKNVIFF